MTRPGLDIDALHAALDRERQSREMSWRDVARETGVSAATLSRLAQGKRPDVDGFAALVDWLGLSADDFLRPGRPPQLAGTRADSSAPAAISAYLRARRELDPQVVAMLEDIIASAHAHLRTDEPTPEEQ